MAGQRIRAVVLAAGLATRLRPLTNGRPKALLPVLGRPLVAGTLDCLAGAGVEAAAINLHYRGEEIATELGEDWQGMPLHYSHEVEILGTLGGLVALREFLAPADLVLVVNGDSLCRWPVQELVDAHVAADGVATLLLLRRPDVAEFGPVGVDDEGRIVSFPGAAPVGRPAAERVFGGAHVFAPELLAGLPAERSDSVIDLYRPGIARGLDLRAYETDAPWHDLGTGRRYLEALLDWAGAEGTGGFEAPTADVAVDAVLTGCVVEAGVRVGSGVVCRGCALLPDAEVGEGAKLEGAVVGDGVVIPPGAEVRDAVLTVPELGTVETSRVEGAVVYTPFGV